MEDLIFLILVFLSLINSKIKCGNKFFNDYMEIENTNNVKGIFVWMIFFRHFTGYYMRNPKKVSIIIDSSFDQNIVSLFLFYSGYGIYKSFLKKGIKYIKTLPLKSTILFIKTQLILLMFLLNNIILHKKISLKEYFYAVILKKSIGNSYWFAFTIIIIYIETFFAFILLTNKKYNFLGIIFLTIICFFHAKFVYNYYHRNEIISIDNYFSLLSIIVYLYYKFYTQDEKAFLLYKISKNFFFTLIGVILTMKIQLKNDFLKFLNSHSYSIYLLQRIVFIYISQKGILKSYPFIRFFFDFSIVILMSCLFDKYSINIDIFLKNYKKKSQNIQDNKKLIDY
jgi:peptidoglycan/LPS O-acetylase OafA/YrhL